jgi:putative RNA 2'-phosphotransferase
MMHEDPMIKTGRFLSLILRHQPEKIGIVLDPAGWASVEELLAKTNAHGVRLDLAMLKEIVRTNNKKRFCLSEDGKRIRANQGHSVDIALGLAPVVPPHILYHGTATRFWASIEIQGLLKGSRQHVHLSTDVVTARKVGMRHGVPLILRIDAQKMVDDNFVFYCSDNGVWLVDHVPTIYIEQLG